MKRTQKQEKKILDETRNKLMVASFNLDGTKYSTYSRIGLIDACDYMAKKALAGKLVLLLLDKDHDMITSYELREGKRITFEQLKPFSVSMSWKGDEFKYEESFETRSRAYEKLFPNKSYSDYVNQ